ncbi:energy-coupling factor transporter transmembrane component T family protein [Arthrobacter sp. NPDC090010]|uniref:energy-coupling factor transporter transmembrane component T family protein n=1 Tax=Arthrobacter sp. NPDC090010 TaxID=3363942 RepID=UPI0037F20FD6
MNGHRTPLGEYLPGNSWLHRTPVGVKTLAVLMLGLATFWLSSWQASCVTLLIVALLFASIRPGWQRFLRLFTAPAPLLALILVFQSWQLGPGRAVSIVANIACCLLGAAVLTLTTPMTVLLDGVARAARPFRRFGLSPERVALLIGITLRSIPYLLGTFGSVRDAARARGLERNPRARILPVLIASVAYAQRTGDALTARGLMDGEDDREEH